MQKQSPGILLLDLREHDVRRLLERLPPFVSWILCSVQILRVVRFSFSCFLCLCCHTSVILCAHILPSLTKVLQYKTTVSCFADEVLMAVSGAENMGLKAASRREHESIVENYKELIKEQVGTVCSIMLTQY